MVAANAGDLIAADIVHELFKQFLEREKEQAPNLVQADLMSNSQLQEDQQDLRYRKSNTKLDDVDHATDDEKAPLAREE